MNVHNSGLLRYQKSFFDNLKYLIESDSTICYSRYSDVEFSGKNVIFMDKSHAFMRVLQT